MRLAKVFGTTPDFWLTLQSRFEVEKTGAEIASELKQIKPRELVVA
ncbi:hypothetical protein NK6_4111 [Bradyrhizobium diazoefficiens]|uniref:Addiction module antidote protein, HigA family n=1 Tax=Bradyrhizobium diazoefficiens TaxID=1355477 RepID=A0A0E3VUE7_9BRAD|nr:hypothetical protein NK6_4111 [Bradyrhizobium diazoefficiens]